MRTLCTTLLIIILGLISAPLAADTIAFSVNSDSGTPDEDSLYRINLDTGTYELVGKIPLEDSDVEGLALDAANTLYAFNDESLTLFTLNKQNAAVSNEHILSDLPFGGGNDVGMTFACDGTLFMTSVATNMLYRVNLPDDLEVVGPLGANIDISGIAAYGNPARLFGLGNGNTKSPNLYEIHTGTGAATPVGTLGSLAAPYNEGGLDFDANGQLWAITDRRIPDDLGSQVLRIDIDRGSDLVTEATTLVEVGFESLAIAPPAGCDGVNPIDPPDPVDPPGVDGPPPSGSAYHGVPIMHPVGLALTALLLLVTGLIAVRRF
jgi:hypothetical protein